MIPDKTLHDLNEAVAHSFLALHLNLFPEEPVPGSPKFCNGSWRAMQARSHARIVTGFGDSNIEAIA